MNPNPPVRRSPIAGAWYPSNPEVLRSEIDGYIDAASESTLPGEVIGLIAPHAGYFYSGHTAGYAYRSVKGMSFDTCAIFSPLHDYMPNNFLTSAHEAYATPLGQVPVDHELVEACSRSVESATGDTLQHIANDREHSLEIQLPFLQRAWQQDFSLLPIMLRTLDAVKLKELADAIYSVVKGQDFLVIASTDLSHFYPLDMAEALDAEMLRRVKAFQPEAVLTAEQEGSAAACGAGAVAAMLWIAKHVGADQVHILNYSTSADATGDASAVVGYASAAVLQSLS